MKINFDSIILKTNLKYPLFKRGKVRDLYDLGDKLLIVSTDRISAFDIVLNNGIPYKGEALNMLSAHWFTETKDIAPNHLLKVVNSRSILVKRTDPIKIEFVVRGYMYGSAWRKYQKGEAVSGIKLPLGLDKAEKLPQPILTPTTKSEIGHDIELTMEGVVQLLGKKVTQKIENLSFKLYQVASKYAEKKDIIIADTKFEFGLWHGKLILIDEILTPDSSRLWPMNKYKIGNNQPSFDKQFMRDYLDSLNWDKQPPPPNLPEHIILETSKKYIEAYEQLTEKSFTEQLKVNEEICAQNTLKLE